MSTNPFGDQPNPYQTPIGAPGYGASDNSARVQAPAIALMVLGAVGIVLTLLSGVLNVSLIGAGVADGDNVARNAGRVMGVVLGVVVNSLIVYGGMRMKNMDNYGWAMGASIMAMLPCSCACLAGIPIGIWSLVTLNDPLVKAAFGKR